MKLADFASEYGFMNWLHAENIMGEEARSRCMDFIRWIFQTPDPEPDPADHRPWSADIKDGYLVMERDDVQLKFCCEGYAALTFHDQGSPDEMVQRYYAYKQENGL